MATPEIKLEPIDEAAPYEENMVIIDKTNGAIQNSMSSDNHLGFIQFAYPRNYNILRMQGLSVEQAKKVAKWMTIQQAGESQYGKSNGFKNKNNRSGFMSNNKVISFPTHDQNDVSLYKSFLKNKNWRRALSANTFEQYLKELQTPKGPEEYRYEAHYPDPSQYGNFLKSLTSFTKELNKWTNSGATDKYTYNTPTENVKYNYFG